MEIVGANVLPGVVLRFAKTFEGQRRSVCPLLLLTSRCQLLSRWVVREEIFLERVQSRPSWGTFMADSKFNRGEMLAE